MQLALRFKAAPRVMESETWTKGYDETVALISRWRGSKAIAWQYIAGHGRFLLRLVRQDEASRRSAFFSAAIVRCFNCSAPSGPTLTFLFHPHRTVSARCSPL